MNTARDKFANYLKTKGLKFTPERRMILEGVLFLHTHFDVNELYEQLCKENNSVSRSTIYRTFPLLVDSGIIKEVLFYRDKIKYEHIFGHKHHDHMVCISCGKVIEFRDTNIEELQKSACKRYGFKPVEHRLSIRGYCQKCFSKLKKRKGT